MSNNLLAEMQFRIEELEIVRAQLAPLVAKPPGYVAGDMENAAASAMLHSFYTEIEKVLVLIARKWDGQEPSGERWHRDLLHQMSVAIGNRPAVLSPDSVEVLGEFLAFRHLFRGASIALMRWEKLAPLLSRVDSTHSQVTREFESFKAFVTAQKERTA